jgi:putative DNA primase/helicase
VLPPDILNLIRDGVENDDRSANFFKAVAALKQRFWKLDGIVAMFEKYPQGIAKKYAGRVAQETKRVFDKFKPGRDKLPVITLRDGESVKIVGEIESALHKAGVPVFERGGALVHTHRETFEAGIDFHTGEPRKSAALKQYTPEALALDAGRSATFIKWKKEKGALVPFEVDAPGNHVRLMMHNSRHWSVRPIVGVATTPIMRADGSIIGGNRPLYDARSRLYYVPGVHVRDIDENPSKDDAAKALAWLRDQLLGEFPFAGDVDRSVALSALMTPLVRASMDVAPMHMVRANTAGSGKSYLVETASMIATGELPAIATYTPNEDEMRKHFSALLMRGAPIFSLDNASTDVGGDFLCQILTQAKGFAAHPWQKRNS